MSYKIDISEPSKPVNKILVLFLAVIVIALCAFGIHVYQTMQAKALLAEQDKTSHDESAYSKDLPVDVLQAFEEYKAIFVKNKLADSENRDTPTEKLTITHIRYYESATTALYQGDLQDQVTLAKIMQLIQYVPEMFEHELLSNLLYNQNPELVDFAIHYRIQTTLIKHNIQIELEKDVKLSEQVIAEQQAKILHLQGKVAGYQNREQSMLLEIEQLKKPPQLSIVPDTPIQEEELTITKE